MITDTLQLNNAISNLKSFDSIFRILEADLINESKKKYLKEHIPNAIYFDASYNSTSSNFVDFDLPDDRKFANYLGSLGISNRHFIIIYDRSKYGLNSSARAWFLFKVFGKDQVSILNGGFNSFKSNNFGLQKEIIKFPQEKFETKLRRNLYKNFEDMQTIIKAKNETIIDAREIDEYNRGHIPGALNIPYSNLFDSQTRLLKTKQQLLKIIRSKNVDLEKPIVTYCQKNPRGSALMFVLDFLGAEKVSLYIGSWGEYSKRTGGY
ncbi:unnamed protein product [Brachionus calyciflorus]|uniref:Rhodanese domain-containing protein n=1 Tax=Brachionus calyciflorus TaxID=104777 RepID=A0A813NSF7_9BILA|nr:unnamed protein product [Brachionus calyciflorus]